MSAYDLDYDQSGFDIEDSEDVIGIAKSLVNGRHPGILATVDELGKPQLRWMSTLSFEDFPIIHTLTSPTSRKVAEIKNHPDVNWMFSNKDLSLVLNFHGKARVIEDVFILKLIWEKIVDKSQTYFLNQYGGDLGFVVIETRVDSIECASPKNTLRFSMGLDQLTPTP